MILSNDNIKWYSQAARLHSQRDFLSGCNLVRVEGVIWTLHQNTEDRAVSSGFNLLQRPFLNIHGNTHAQLLKRVTQNVFLCPWRAPWMNKYSFVTFQLLPLQQALRAGSKLRAGGGTRGAPRHKENKISFPVDSIWALRNSRWLLHHCNVLQDVVTKCGLYGSSHQECSATESGLGIIEKSSCLGATKTFSLAGMPHPGLGLKIRSRSSERW